MTRQVEKRHRKYERILASREPERRTEEALVIARISRLSMGESHLDRTPGRASGNAAGTHPRRQKQLGRLARRRHRARQAMRQDRMMPKSLELDVRGLVNQTLIPTDTFERGAKCGARDHRIEMDVERPELCLFRKVQSKIVVVGDPYRVGEEADTSAHWHGRIVIEQRVAIDALCVQEWPRIVAQPREARDHGTQGTNGQPRFAMPHPGTSLHSERRVHQIQPERDARAGGAHPGTWS
jgi:hypothetical protein